PNVNEWKSYSSVSNIEVSASNTEKFSMAKQWVQMMETDCLAAKTVTLAINAKVMLVANLDANVGLINGSCGIVKGFLDSAKTNTCNNKNGIGLDITTFEKAN